MLTEFKPEPVDENAKAAMLDLNISRGWRIITALAFGLFTLTFAGCCYRNWEK